MHVNRPPRATGWTTQHGLMGRGTQGDVAAEHRVMSQLMHPMIIPFHEPCGLCVEREILHATNHLAGACYQEYYMYWKTNRR